MKNSRTENHIISGAVPLPRWIFLAILVVIFIAGLAFSTWFFQRELEEQGKEGPTLQSIRRLKEIVIGISAPLPPLQYRDERGILIGFNIDLGERIAAELGVEGTLKDFAADRLFLMLDEKRVDAVISAVTNEEKQSQAYDFSIPYLTQNGDSYVIIFRKGNEDLVQKINTIVEKLRYGGVLEEFQQKWFES